MEFEVKVLPRPEDPFNWKDCHKKISLAIEMTKKVQERVRKRNFCSIHKIILILYIAQIDCMYLLQK